MCFFCPNLAHIERIQETFTINTGGKINQFQNILNQFPLTISLRIKQTDIGCQFKIPVVAVAFTWKLNSRFLCKRKILSKRQLMFWSHFNVPIGIFRFLTILCFCIHLSFIKYFFFIHTIIFN